MKTAIWFTIFLSLFSLHLQADEYVGFTKAYSQVEVAAAEIGIIDKIVVTPGNYVEKGQILASLDSRELKASLRIAVAQAERKGNINAYKAELKLNKQKLERLSRLKSANYAVEKLDNAKANVVIIENKLQAAMEQHLIDQLEVEKIRVQMERRILRSTISGVVREIFYQPGERINNNKPGIIQLVEIERLAIIFYIPLAKTKKLHVGQKIPITLCHPKTELSGTIEFIDPVANAASATVKVKVVISNQDRLIRGGVRCLLKL